MKRREKVELFEEIRREHEFGVGTIKGVARKLGVHRRMVRQALTNPQLPERRRSVRSVVGPLIPFINAILEADLNAPRASSAIPLIASGSASGRSWGSG